jgi:hypothetical protein
MLLDTITFLFVVGLLGAILWDMHRTNVQAHLHTQDLVSKVTEALERIARYLGTDRS